MQSVVVLADLAASQWGLVTTSQAGSYGVTAQTVARLADQGALERMAHGVYRVTGTPPSPLDGLRVAWISLAPARLAHERLRDASPIVVSHRSAAAVHQVGDLEADEFEFTMAQRKQSRRHDIRIHRGQIEPVDWAIVDGLPVTSVIRTVVDLAAARVDGGHLAGIVRDAIVQQQVDYGKLVLALAPYAHRYGARMGAGEAFLATLLQEAGVSEPIERAVDLAGRPSHQRTDLRASADLRELVERIRDDLVPLANLSDQFANSPTATDLAELLHYAQTPAGQSFLKQYSDLARRSRAALDAFPLADRQDDGSDVVKEPRRS